MADNYLLFSEVLAHLTPRKKPGWGSNYGPLPCSRMGKRWNLRRSTMHRPASMLGRSSASCGIRKITNSAWGELGFQFAFHDDHDTPDGLGRHLWFFAEESGTPDNVAWLVRKFLKQFRPGECWSLTYAATCSKPRAGEFGGGAVFVTAEKIKWQDARSYIEREQARFERVRSMKKGKRR